MAEKPDLIAYTVKKKGEREFFTRIGAAWSHKSGKGMTLQLDAMPLDGRIVVLPPKSKEDAEA